MLQNSIDIPLTGHHQKDRPSSYPSNAPVENHTHGGRKIKVVKRVLDANDMMAAAIRKRFTKNRVFVLNMMSSPGSGKTTILEKSLKYLTADFRCGVIVGDICTTADADRLAASGVPVVQINTDEFGGDCHLGAHVIEKALGELDLKRLDILIVENIGNLVCPAEFDIGEDRRVVILSVTEGEDKPLKYPLMFRECDAALLNKIDLLPHLDYDVEQTVANILRIHPGMPVFKTSARAEEGLEPWIEWIRSRTREKLK